MRKALVPAAVVSLGLGLVGAGPAAATAPTTVAGASAATHSNAQGSTGQGHGHAHGRAHGHHPGKGQAHGHTKAHGKHGHHGKVRGHGHSKGDKNHGTPRVSYVDNFVLPDELRTVDGVPFGGISGLDYRPEQDSYLAISDDRSQKGPARFHELELPFNDNGFIEQGYAVTDTTMIQREDGSSYPETSVDPESIRWDKKSGTALWTDEGDANQRSNPAIREMTEDGEFVREFQVPEQYLLKFDQNGTQTAGVRNNLAFENLTLGPKRKTFSVMNEGALVQDGPVASPETGSNLRLAQFDRKSGQNTAQYVYQTEPMSSPRGSTGGDRGAPEILQLSKTDYLVIERQYFEGKNEIQVYKASTKVASEVAGMAALTGSETPMTKELVIDLEMSGMMPGNVEAISFGPEFSDGDKSLVLAADDNFNLATQDTVFHLLRVDTNKKK